MNFEDLKKRLQACIESTDTEEAHMEADNILTEIILGNPTLTSEERIIIIELYEEVGKWFA